MDIVSLQYLPPISQKADLAAAILLATLLAVPPSRAGDAFYVWQRDWQERVSDAVLAERESVLFVLVAEWREAGDVDPSRVQVPWRAVQSALSRVVPVFRIPVGHLAGKRLPERIASEFEQLCRVSGHTFASLQLDLDCPERRLAEYASVLRSLRERLPGIALSATVLPCQMDRAEIKQVIDAVDFAVLQVHGLTVPKRLSDVASLVDRRTALRALEAARRLSPGFMVALPTYAYEMRFDTATGAFAGLGAEGPTVVRPDTVRRMLQPDWPVVAELVRWTRACESPDACSGIAWFRLPVPGDRLCLERSAVSELQAGKCPDAGMDATWRAGAPGRHDLLVSNRATFSAQPVVIRLEWPAFRGDYDLLNGYAPATGSLLPGVVPEVIAGPTPPPGQSLVVGWFRAAGPPGKANTVPQDRGEESDQ